MSATKKNTNSAKSKKTDASLGQSRTIGENRKARHRFEIIDQLECGIVLVGSEVKSLREGKLALDQAYVRVRGNEIWLVSADIAEYRQASIWNHNPQRHRKLLVHSRQRDKLKSRAHERGMTLVPLRVYFNERGIVKVMVAVCRGKKLYDKRETKKTKDVKRDLDRAMKSRR